MAPLVAIGATLAPEIIRWLGGPRAAEVSSTVGSVIEAVAGSRDAQAVEAALAADPGKALELRVRLAEVAAQEAAAERQAELDAFRASLADTQHAREQSSDLAKARHPLAYGAAAVTAILLALFTYALSVVLAGIVPVENQRMADLLLGQLMAWVGAAITYWVGSSRGSAEKTEQAMAQRR